MHAYTLSHVDDDTLLTDLAALVATDRETTASLLAHIAEVDARGLFLPAACSSMFVYCVRVLHLGEDAAYKRIRAARTARRFPQIFDAIADGRLHVTGVGVLAAHLTDENVDEVLAAAAHRSKPDLEVLVARLAPLPDVPPAITPLVAPTASLPLPELALEPVAPTSEPPVTRMKPLAPERFALQVTISQEARDKLERAQALVRHRNPSGDLAYVVELATDALIAMLEREKRAATSRPRAPKARPDDANPRYIPADAKRTVYERDGEQCAFVSDSGVRCTERNFLEIDHITPVALGGRPTSDGLRLLCRAHNAYEAERKLGADFMRRKREKARRPELSDLALALRGLGFTPAETRDAMADTTPQTAPDFEERLRAALVGLTRARSSRCSDGPLDWNIHPLAALAATT